MAKLITKLSRRPYKRPESVLVVVHALDQVLLLQRKDDPTFWQSVTGSMLTEESHPLVSAIRELAEETGLKTEQGHMRDCECSAWFDIYPHWQFRYAPGVRRNLEHVFCFEMTAPVLVTLSDEHLDYCWLDKDKAAQKVISETNREAILRFVPSSPVL